MPFLIKRNVAATNVNGDSFVHMEGSVVSEWELSDLIREKIKEGSEHYRTSYEPLTSHEAHHYRVKATSAEGPRNLDGEVVKPPWDDYVGLHPTEITERMRDAPLPLVEQVKRYEQAGMNRQQIVEFVSPAEREPWEGYSEAGVREVLEKFAILSDPAVADAVAYEHAHKNREAIVTWDRETYEQAPSQKVTV